VVFCGLEELTAVAGGVEKRVDSGDSSAANCIRISNYLKEMRR
jgi:hypothetical protein